MLEKKRFSFHDKKFSHIYIYIIFLDISLNYRDAYKYLNYSFFCVLSVIWVSLGIRAVQMYLYIILKKMCTDLRITSIFFIYGSQTAV